MSAQAYPQLDAIAASLGLARPGASFSLRHQGWPLAIALDISSGTVTGMTITAGTPPLPKLTLSRETSFDRLGKSLGVNREIQLGDASFDAQVYIDDDETVEPIARRALAPPVVRRAIQELLALGATVRFGAEGVTLTVGEREDGSTYDAGRFHAILPPLLALASALPRFTVPGEAAPPLPPLPHVTTLDELQRLRPASKPSTSARLALGAYVLVLSAGWIAASLAYSTAWKPVDSLASILVCLGAALVAWLLSLPVGALAVRGKASSLQSLLVLAIVLAPAVGPVGASAIWIYNGAADRSPQVAHVARITAIEPAHNDDDVVVGAMVEVASWKDPDARYSFSFQGWPPRAGVAKGGTITVFTRAGALGFAYLDGTNPPSQ